MLRGSYAGGSLNVTARRPYRRPGPSAILHARVQAPGARPLRYPCGAVPISSPPLRVDLLRRATPPPFAAVLLLRVSMLPFAVALQNTAVPSRLLAERLVATPSPCAASDCQALPSLRWAMLCPCGALHFKSLAELSITFALPRFALPSPRSALRCGAVAVRGSSWPSYPMPLRVGSLPILRGAVRFAAPPSHLASKLCWAVPSQRQASQCSSFANRPYAVPSPWRRIALLFPRHARPRSAHPSPI